MKILVVGSGGREHALAWKISQSPQVKKLYCAPGNAGTLNLAENLQLDPSGIRGLQDFAAREKIDLTVIGPELPLTLGVTDEFEKKGLKIFGPQKNAAELEGSKVFAKEFMERHKIPSGRYKIADSESQAIKMLNTSGLSYPLVVKADGLAAGKGVIICKNRKDAEKAVDLIMVEKKFGDSGKRIVLEEFLRGKEASFIVVTDGVNVAPFVTTMDHKAAFDGDKGPNTGGMGAISPSPFINQEMFAEIMKTIIFPTVTGMLEEGRKYRGVLYVGVMLTEKGPKVLEYNCRFGDPETQPQMLRLETDLVDVFLAGLEGNVSDAEIRWNQKASGCVVLASGGYPGSYEKGKRIAGIKEASQIPNVVLFHAGTKHESGEFTTSGGRVLGVCSSESTLKGTMDRIYSAISRIHFEGMHYRRDIGAVKEEK